MDVLNPDTTIAELLITIQGRYSVSDDVIQTNALKDLFPESKDNVRVVRVKRSTLDRSSWKTLLFAFNIDQHSVAPCFSWAASVQQELLNNESSDLYLFIIPNQINVIPTDSCLYIESNDQYCRKYVLRPQETFPNMLNRTFLHEYDSHRLTDDIADPLVAALDKTGQAITTFTLEEQSIWKKILLSGRQGTDTAEALMAAALEILKNDKT